MRIPTVSLLLVMMLLCGCAGFPPAYDQNPHVTVGYTFPTALPDSKEVLFMKSVTQLSTTARTKANEMDIFLGSHWETYEKSDWSKLFICSMNLDTGQKRVIREWPRGLDAPGKDYKISRPLHNAAFLTGGDYQTLKIAVINFDTFKWSYISCTNSPFSAPAYLDLSPDEKAFVVSIRMVYLPPGRNAPYVEGIAVCHFDGKVQFLPTHEMPVHIRWLQKSNLIRVTLKSKFIVVDPDSLAIVEEGKLDKSNWYGQVPPAEDHSPLDAQYNLTAFNLGTPGCYKGNFSPDQAAELW